jgi:hypothetical protein
MRQRTSKRNRNGMSAEERRCAHCEAQSRYRTSPRGRSRQWEWRRTPRGTNCNREYEQSLLGRERAFRYRWSDKEGEARRRAYIQSGRFRETAMRGTTHLSMLLIEQKLVSKEFPYLNERCLLVQLNRMVSKRVTRAIVGGNRRRGTNQKSQSCYECRDMHGQYACTNRRWLVTLYISGEPPRSFHEFPPPHLVLQRGGQPPSRSLIAIRMA